MTKRETAVLSFKVMSVYAIIKAIAKVPDILYFISANDLTGLSMLAFVSMALQPLSLVLCGLVLWYIAPLLASFIFKSTVSEDKSDTSPESIQATAFSIAGLFLLGSVLPDLLKSATMHYAIVAYSVQGRSPLTGTIIISVLQIVLGLWLLLGSRGLVNFIRSMRRD